MSGKLMRILKHRWLDERDSARTLGRDGIERLVRRKEPCSGWRIGEFRNWGWKGILCALKVKHSREHLELTLLR